MRKFLKFLPLLAFLWSCRPGAHETLRIATAANMQFTMEELVRQFEMESGIKCELIVSSSGKLTAQIREGAPFDVFVSADMKYPQTLFDEGLCEEAPQVYALGKLVLWSYSGSIMPSVEFLKSDSLRHLAVANPKTAPYGTAALEVLRYYDLEETLKNKLVFGESIAQTNQFIVSGAAEAGFTAMSVVLAPEMKNKGKWIEISPELYTPIEQGVVILKPGEASRHFYHFIFSAAARKVLKEFGYSVSE